MAADIIKQILGTFFQTLLNPVTICPTLIQLRSITSGISSVIQSQLDGLTGLLWGEQGKHFLFRFCSLLRFYPTEHQTDTSSAHTEWV